MRGSALYVIEGSAENWLARRGQQLVFRTEGFSLTNLNLWKLFRVVILIVSSALTAVQAQTFTKLVDFDGTDGEYPYFMALVQNTDGDLYGTTYYGGVNHVGTLFEMSRSGELTVLYNFDTSAEFPAAGLTLGRDGNLYGTTAGGGNGYGTVFKLTSKGTFHVLHTFRQSDGASPYGPLFQASDGNFYGTTADGGNNGCGTVFRITPNGTFTNLYSFMSNSAGHPMSGVVQGIDGALYGTTSGGDCCAGSVYRITVQGKFSTLHLFCSDQNCSDGDTPVGGLVLANDGSFYGTTEYGGSNSNNQPYGTVYKITPAGAFTIIYDFCSAPNCTDGGAPFAGLIQATDGPQLLMATTVKTGLLSL